MTVLPTIPPTTLRDLTFLLLVISFTVRIYMLSSPLNKARIQLSGQIKDTVSSLKGLQIPGMKRFLVREFLLLTIPYLFAAVFFLRVPLSDISLTELGLTTTMITVLGLTIWLFIDVRRSVSANQFLNDLLDDITAFETKLETFQVSISAGLSILVAWKIGLAKIARKIVKTTIRKSAKEKLDSEEASNIPGAKIIVNVIDAIDTILGAPKELVRVGIDTIIRKFDDTLELHFKQYSERAYSDLIMTLFLGLFPCTWLLFIIYLSPFLIG